MKFFRSVNAATRAALAGAVAVVCSADARAAEAPLVDGYVALLSNYVGRGLAQSVGEPSLQAEVNYNPSNGWYGGLSASSINWIDQLFPGSSVSVEVDGWLGYRQSFADDWTFKGGVLRLQFPGRYAPQVTRPDTTELFGSIAWRNVSARINYAITDAFGTPDSRGSWYLDIAAALPLNDAWTAGAHVGRKQGRGGVGEVRNDRSSYNDYKLSLTRRFAHSTSVTLAYTGTSADPELYTLNNYNVAGSRFHLALQKNF